MAGRKPKYVPQGIPKEITATSRYALKIRDNYYTIEAQETRIIPDPENANMEYEWRDLFGELQDIIDDQAEEIYQTFKKAK